MGDHNISDKIISYKKKKTNSVRYNYQNYVETITNKKVDLDETRNINTIHYVVQLLKKRD